MNEIKIINNALTFSKRSYNIELEINNKTTEIVITEDYNERSETILVDWDFVGGYEFDDDTEEDENARDKIDDWVKSFKYLNKQVEKNE